MKKAIIIMAALLLPFGAVAQAAHSSPKAAAKKAAKAKKPAGPAFVFVGQNGKVVDMKKDKCWNPNVSPYRAPGWC